MTNFFIKLFGALYIVVPQPVFEAGVPEVIIQAPAQEIEISTEISAESMLIFDIENNTELASNNPDQMRAMASLTKLMTALIILENHSLDEVVLINNNYAETEGSKAWFFKNEEITVENLLKALLIHSANDSALILAVYDAGSVDKFVQKMNIRAKNLGLKNTQFKNPHGLDAVGHYSSAHDLAFLSSFLLREKNSFFRRVVNTSQETIYSTDKSIIHKLDTTNDLLLENLSVYGVKTGTTDNAGQCLISLIKRRQKEYLIIVLGSEDRYLDTKLLINELPY